MMKIEHRKFKSSAGRNFTARILSADPPPGKETFRVIHARAKAYFEAVVKTPEVK